jgi:ABC-type sugar transport system ATPase subunit
VTILIASSDLEEVVGLADRVHVVVRGRIVETLARDQITRERILEAATR